MVAIVAATYLALPAGTPTRSAFLGLVGTIAAIATGVTALRRPGPRRAAWLLLSVGLATRAVADGRTAIRIGLDLHDGSLGDPILLLHPVAIALLGLGIARLGARQGPRDGSAVIDGVIVATSIAAGFWVLLVIPAWTLLGGHPVGRLLTLAYPAVQVLLLGAGVRLAFVADLRARATRFLLAAVAAHTATAVAIGALVLTDGLTSGSWANVGVITAHAFIALAATEPSRDHILPRRPSLGPRATVRAGLLALALLVVPVIQVMTIRSGVDLVVTLATAALLALVTARIWLLLREQERGRSHALQRQQERERRRFEGLVAHSSDALVVIDSDDHVVYASPSATEVLGADPHGWTTEDLAEVIHPDERRATTAAFRERLEASDGRPIRINARLHDRDGRERHIELVAADLRDDLDVEGLVLTIRDTTMRVELERRLRHLAFHDALTGLSNRQLFGDRLVQALARAERTGGRVAVLLCDLDDFKDVNDSLGHAVGDRLLVALARRLEGAARRSDTVARLGGDEFAVLLEGIAETQDAIDGARRLLDASRQPIEIDGHELDVDLSIGIAVDAGERSAEELLRDADVALYEAKAQGKRRWALHRTTMTLRAQARLRLAGDLARAITEGGIEVAYQPVVMLGERDRIVGVEALARWHHPVRGWVPPVEFIPLAEQSGHIGELGDRVLDNALGTLAALREERPELVLRLGVNVSARQLRDPGFVERTRRLLAHHGVEPGQLLIELTESTFLEDTDDALRAMGALRDAGVRLAVDDFGTGYSSLAYLRRLPVDIVKIDRSFVHELEDDPTATELVTAIVDLCASLGKDVIAEGVETAHQRSVLHAAGCSFAQGYLFSRPLTSAGLSEVLLSEETAILSRADLDPETGAIAVPRRAVRSGAGAT